jgi:hypothetical protein
MRFTLNEAATRAALSVSTTSRVLHREPAIRPTAAAKVQRVADELRSHPVRSHRPIGKPAGAVLIALSATAFAVQLLSASAFAVDTVADWTGENTNAANNTMTVVTTNNNYGVISDTSVGGTIQSKINLGPEGFANVNEHHVYLSDPTLVDGAGNPLTLDFTTPLHMEGTITFNSPAATEPNICFCWYASGDTTHRIGLGISNLTATQNPPDGAVANRLRIDLGYATNPPTGQNRFYNVSADGSLTQSPSNSTIPNGTYPFTFDYTPGPTGQAGGSVSATVGDFFFTRSPLENQPWDNDLFTFDRFGFVQRSTGSTTQNPTNTYEVVFSNFSYTGGTEFQSPDLDGDYNADGKVDAADYVVWRKSDINGQQGYDDWRANFGLSPGAGAALATGGPVPEPDTLILGLGACVALLVASRKNLLKACK